MIKVINTVTGSPRINVKSGWYSKDGPVDYIGNIKNKIKNNHYLFVKLTFNGLTENQKVSNTYLNMYYKNAFNNIGVKVIKCNNAIFSGFNIENIINSFTGNEDAIENILIKGTEKELEEFPSIFTIDLSNITKNIKYDDNSIMFAINFQFGLTDDFEIYDPQAISGMHNNSENEPSNCEATITEVVGLNSAYKYDLHSLLNCGTANLNLASGKSIYSKTLMSSASKKMPIVFSIYQNADNDDTVMHFRNKVVPSFHYRIYKDGDNYVIEDPTGFKSYYTDRKKIALSDDKLKEKYKTIDFENGHIYYSSIDKSYIHVDNSLINPMIYLYDKKKNYIKFLINNEEEGKSTLIQEAGNRHGHKLIYHWIDKRLQKIENSDNEVMNFEYTNDGYIKKVLLSCVDQYVEFEENISEKSLCLKTFSSFTDPKVINETYLYFNDNSTLKKIKDGLTNYYLDFSYYPNKQMYKASSYDYSGRVKEYETTYTYGDRSTNVTDLNYNSMYYYFNNYGFLQLVMDNYGKSITYNYDEFNGETGKKLSGVSKIQNNSRNLIENHSFENDNIFSTNSFAWKKSGDDESNVNIVNDGLIGNKCLKIISSTNNEIKIWQDVADVKFDKYKFKGFIKNLNLTTEKKNKIKLYLFSKYHIPTESNPVEKYQFVSLNENEKSWYEFEEDIVIEENAYNISFKVGLDILPTDVEIYLDELQLITNSYYVRSNLIENGYLNFVDDDNQPSGWNSSNLDENDHIINKEIDELHLDIFGKNVFKISSRNLAVSPNNEYKNKKIYKIIQISGKKGDQLTFSVFAKSCVSLNTTFRSFVHFVNNNTIFSECFFDFEKNLDNWQMLTRSISAVDDYSAVIVGVEYIGSSNVLVDCFQLYKESFSTIIKYDNDGNINGIDSGNGIIERYVYDDNGNIIEVYNDDGSYYQYEYDENDLLVKTKDMYGNTLTLEYDSDDRVILQTLRMFDGEIIYTSKTYDDVNNEESITDEFGLKIIKKMDYLNRIITQSVDTYNSEIKYEYYDNSQLKHFYTKIEDIKYGNTLTYDNFGNIKTVQSENGTLYNLSYDRFGKLTSIKVNNHIIEQYHYDTSLSNYYNTKLDGISLAKKGENYELIYNELNQIKEIKLNNVTIATYTYDENGNVYKLSMFNNGSLKDMYFTYNLNGQLLKIKTSDNQEFRYTYDNLGYIQNKVYNINNEIRSLGYQYGYENNQFNKYNLGELILRKYDGDVVYNSPSGKGLNGAKPLLNTCSNYYDEESGLNFINFDDKYEFINYKMSSFYSYDDKKYSAWKFNFNKNKTFFMLIKPTGSYALENLFTFGIMDENETVNGITLKSHLAVNTNGKIIYYNDSPSSPIVTSSGKLKLNEWNLVGIQFVNNDIVNDYVRIILNDSVTSNYFITENVKDLNYLIIGYQATLMSSSSSTGSSYASSTTTSNLTMPFKIGLMIFGAYNYQNNDIEYLYYECKKYFEGFTTYKVNSTIYYNPLVYEGFDVVTLNGTLDSVQNLKPYETPEIDTSFKIQKPQIFKYDEELNKFVFGCYKEQIRSLKYILPLKNKGTISLKFKTEATNKNRTILSIKNLEEEICNLTINNSNKLKFWFNNDLSTSTNVIVHDSERQLTDTRWHHLVIIYNQSILQVYVDNLSTPLYVRKEGINLDGSIISLGNSFDGNSPLYGSLEMLSYSEQYQSNAVINKIIQNGNPIIVSDEYDTIGRLRKTNINIKNRSFNIDYEYDKTRIKKQKFWDDYEMSYQYDYMGNISEICYNENDNKMYSKYKYNKLGMLEEETLADGTITSYTYDQNGNIKNKCSKLNGVEILKEEYSYDEVIKDRLVSVTNELTNSISTQIVYNLKNDDSNNENSDNEFYPSSINGKNLIWEGNLLKSYKGLTFEYDANGIRTKIIKQNSSSEIVKTTSFVLEGSNIISMTINELTREYKLDFTYDANSKLIGLTTIQGDYFYVRDVIGNIIGLIDSNGNYVIEYKYDAWGKLLSNLPFADDNTACIAAKYNPFIYKGYYYDVETNLFLITSRYYSPELGRFIQPADVSTLNPSSINGLNLYSYANNNPIGIIYSSSSVGFGTNGGMVCSLSLGGSTGSGTMGSTSSSWFTTLPAVSETLKHISKVNDVFSAVSHSFMVGKYLFGNGKLHTLSYLDDMRIVGANPAKGLHSLQPKWLKIMGYAFSAIDGMIAIYDNLQQGNSWGQSLLDGALSFGKSAASAWVGGFVGANVGGMIGAALGSIIPIPGVGTFIGFAVGTGAGIVVSWFVDDVLGLLKDGLLDLIFD